MASALWAQPAIVTWSQCLLESFRRWTGRELLDRTGSPEDQARALFTAPYVVVSHGTESDPVLNYGNQAALDLWEMTWEQLTNTPSRLTAEPMNRDERARMLAVAAAQGFFAGYRGVRISATGKRFLVEDATVWNVVEARGARVGQAATFARWTPIG
ncbi:MAG TPA: MEKHLA domain-containing protein [Nitrospira sp.]|nr:MEKHLA domain-containing protein [Nitrospira sp.]